MNNSTWADLINSQLDRKLLLNEVLVEPKMHKPIIAPDDILALSVSCHNNRINNRTHGHTIIDFFKDGDGYLIPKIKAQITEEDRIKARLIRDYYSKKIMMWKLLGKELSMFRKDLNTFIHSDNRKVNPEMVGMIYRLPEFYDYDIEFDKMAENAKHFISEKHNYIRDLETKKVKFLRKVKTVRKQLTPKMEYWFIDDNKHLIKVDIAPNNPLIQIWDQLVQTPIELEGYFQLYSYDRRQYLHLNKFNITNKISVA